MRVETTYHMSVLIALSTCSVYAELENRHVGAQATLANKGWSRTSMHWLESIYATENSSLFTVLNAMNHIGKESHGSREITTGLMYRQHGDMHVGFGGMMRFYRSNGGGSSGTQSGTFYLVSY